MPALPPFARSALLLDLDGTLLDIAPTPDEVVVPPGLVDTLLALKAALGGALGVVSGRPVEQIDALLGAVPQAVAGEHGGAIRHSPDDEVERADLPGAPPEMRAAGNAIADAHPGAMLENKARGFVLHYRAVPDFGEPLRAALVELVASDDRFTVMPARMAWEVKPKGADKGTAVASLMARAPFAGRLPVFIGDDVTDLDGIAAATAMGGAGLMVPDTLVDPAGVRAWLARATGQGAWPAS